MRTNTVKQEADREAVIGAYEQWLRSQPQLMGQQSPKAALEGDLAGKVHVLASYPKDRLAAALARLGRAFMVRDS